MALHDPLGIYEAALEAGEADPPPWWIRYLRLSELWGTPPWTIVKGTPGDRRWTKAAWIAAQAILGAADAEAARLRHAESAER